MVAIDRDYRERWVATDRHAGHDVWTCNENDGQIHGTIVGVHLESCIGCMKCQDVCPVDVFIAFEYDNSAVVDPVREKTCIFCLACEVACPTEAIAVHSSIGSDDTLNALLG
jgi:NAD-dependent dihydropyrimidine dehydrogenase PreA subunit